MFDRYYVIIEVFKSMVVSLIVVGLLKRICTTVLWQDLVIRRSRDGVGPCPLCVAIPVGRVMEQLPQGKSPLERSVADRRLSGLNSGFRPLGLSGEVGL